MGLRDSLVGGAGVRAELVEAFDYKHPDYAPIIKARIRLLQQLRSSPKQFVALKKHYSNGAQGCIDFIDDWVTGYDPRNISLGRPAHFPLVMFPKQREFIQWLYDRYSQSECGLVDKSRDSGATVLAVAFSIWLCIFFPGSKIGIGSRKEQLVDKEGDADSIFEKARQMVRSIPREFVPAAKYKHMQIAFTATDSAITGEAGDNIGRGGRNSMYIKDESAFYERPDNIEAALSQNTNVRIDISTPNGSDNPFAHKRFAAGTNIFTLHWRDDPRKDAEWYAQQCKDLPPIIVAREIDINYHTSMENVICPAEWVQAAVNFPLDDSGAKVMGLDVADEGGDANAAAYMSGPVLKKIKSWYKGNTSQTARIAYALCKATGIERLNYDSGGPGAGVKGELYAIREQCVADNTEFVLKSISGVAAGGKVRPGYMFPGKKNTDMFENLKAQEWWSLRQAFEKVYRVVHHGEWFPAHELVSIPNDHELIAELSQVQYGFTRAGKIIVQSKKKSSYASQNKADAFILARVTPKTIVVRV